MMSAAAHLAPRMYLPPATSPRRLVVLNNGGVNSAVLLSLALAHVDQPMHITSLTFAHAGPRAIAARELACAIGALHLLRVPFLGRTTQLAHALEHARALGADAIMYGPDRDDRSDPECRDEFVLAMQRVAFLQAPRHVRILAPLIGLSKASVVLLGAGLDAFFSIARSCRVGAPAHDRPCGVCPACSARRAAFADAHVVDPLAVVTA